MIVGFSGSGNMVAAMARGWAKASRRPEGMLFTDAGSGRAAHLAAEVGGEAVADNRELAERADLVILGFKPKDLDAAAAELQGSAAVCSLLNGTTSTVVANRFPEAEVLRLMPNLAVEHGRGVMGLVVRGESPIADELLELLGGLGRVFRLGDDGIDVVTALASCAPAYLDLFTDALTDAGAAAGAAGIDSEVAREMVIEMMAGTVDLIRERQPGELRRQVASPGGSTEAGLASLDRDDFTGVLTRAVEASLARMRGEI